MNQLDLRPLSIGEVLDRAFTLYRRNFLLFTGLIAIPTVAPLILQVVGVILGMTPLSSGYWIFLPIQLVFGVLAYLFSQGGTVLAVSQLYLNRPTSIAASLSAMSSNVGSLFGAVVLSGLAIGGGLILLIIPGIYVCCRLLICVPCAVIEQRGPRDSLRRAWDLTKGHAGAAFLILLLSAVLAYASTVLVAIPMGLSIVAGGAAAITQPGVQILTMVLSTLASILIQPITMIATAIFYYDMRVRKEAFDLQIMMDPDSSHVPQASLNSIVPE